MTLADQSPAFPTAKQIGFRPEREDDQEFLYRLYASTRTDEMALTGWDDAQKDAFLRMQFQFQTTHYRRHFSEALFQIILLAGEAIGRVYVYHGAQEIRLMDIALLPEYRGAGIGGWILGALMQQAERAHKAITLHVEFFNRARRLYERLGFQIVENQGVNLFMEWRPASCPTE